MLLCSARDTSDTAVRVTGTHYVFSLVISYCKEIQVYYRYIADPSTAPKIQLADKEVASTEREYDF